MRPRRAPRVPRVPEKAVQAQIVTLLRSLGAAVYVLGTTRRRGDFAGTMQTPGIPDLYAILPEVKWIGMSPLVPKRGLWIEVKAAGGRVRPDQAAFAAACAHAQIPYVRGGVDDVIRHLVAGAWLKASNLAHYKQERMVTTTRAETQP